MQHVLLLSGRLYSDSAFAQARSRLPLAVLQGVLANLVKAALAQGLWRGHRAWLIDGSAFCMPDSPPMQAEFGQPGSQAVGCELPVAKILALFHAGTGLLIEVAASPMRTHEMSRLSQVHPGLKADSVLFGDWSSCSFAHLAM